MQKINPSEIKDQKATWSGPVSRVRGTVRSMTGYAPGEQPAPGSMIKLNTNENPYPPSPMVAAAWLEMGSDQLRAYPDPLFWGLRQVAAARFGCRPEEVLAGNGSDDLLTIGVRTFVDQDAPLAYTEPSYSLYPVLGQIQGARLVPLRLGEGDFQLPDVLPSELAECSLLLLARPNAPTSTTFPKERMERLCSEFSGIVWIDEAYADFADDHCLDLVGKFPNVVVSRTLSKSYSLAGLRVGLGFAQAPLVEQMMKVKDSYNLPLPGQILAAAALGDYEYMLSNVRKIRATREITVDALRQLGFLVLPSQANFLFARPPMKAADYYAALRERGVLVRYFPGGRTDEFVRITIGREEEMECFIDVTKEIMVKVRV